MCLLMNGRIGICLLFTAQIVLISATSELFSRGTVNLYDMIKQAIFWSSADILFGINKDNGLVDRFSPEVSSSDGVFPTITLTTPSGQEFHFKF